MKGERGLAREGKEWGFATVDTQDTQPQAQKWPEQRWRQKWSEIIDSLIRSLIRQGLSLIHI